ncbi:hypothetical protein LXL04_038100 [Taraxacum kok-saghyz]
MPLDVSSGRIGRSLMKIGSVFVVENRRNVNMNAKRPIGENGDTIRENNDTFDFIFFLPVIIKSHATCPSPFMDFRCSRDFIVDPCLQRNS